jgi:hypothetical protein
LRRSRTCARASTCSTDPTGSVLGLGGNRRLPLGVVARSAGGGHHSGGEAVHDPLTSAAHRAVVARVDGRDDYGQVLARGHVVDRQQLERVGAWQPHWRADGVEGRHEEQALQTS